MKKRRLKKWVKVVLVVIVLLVVFGMCKALDKLNEKELESCINVGNSREYCERGLR